MICISNPPYNLKWEIPPFAQMEQRFCELGVPPKGNANFAFVLSGFEKADKGIYILPMGVCESEDKDEINIRKRLIEGNYVEAVIGCPENMFEATTICVYILVLNKHKTTTDISFVDMSHTYTEYEREQKGQYGGKAHTNRIYKKKYKGFSDKQIEKVLNAIKGRQNIETFSKTVSPAAVRENKYSFAPTKYLDIKYTQSERRTYADIIKDLNRVIEKRNSCKLVINETVAKNIFGFDVEIYKKEQQIQLPECLDLKIVKDDYITFTKNKNELTFKNNSKMEISEVFMLVMNLWKHHVMLLNTEENRLLSELRDKLIPDLLGGGIEI